MKSVRETRATSEITLIRAARKRGIARLKASAEAAKVKAREDGMYYLLDERVPVHIIRTSTGPRVEFFNQKTHQFEPRVGVLVAVSFGRFPGIRETTKMEYKRALDKLLSSSSSIAL